MRKRANILVVAIAVVGAVGYAMWDATVYVASACSFGVGDKGSSMDRVCSGWLNGNDPVVLASAVAAAVSSVAVWFRRPELIALVAALGFGVSGLPVDEVREADPYDAPVVEELPRDSAGNPITPRPDTPPVAPPPDLRTREEIFDEDAHMTSINVLQEVGRCVGKSHSAPRSCESPAVWQRTGLATDARVTVTIRDRDHYRVDAASAVPPVVYSAIYDLRRNRIVYTCRPAPSKRCGRGRAEDRLPAD